jgi:hypothetical protein
MTAPVLYRIGVSSPITPAEPLPPLPEIPRGSIVIVEGRAPIWRYGMALHPASTARPQRPLQSTIRNLGRSSWPATVGNGRWGRWWT